MFALLVSSLITKRFIDYSESHTHYVSYLYKLHV